MITEVPLSFLQGVTQRSICRGSSFLFGLTEQRLELQIQKYNKSLGFFLLIFLMSSLSFLCRGLLAFLLHLMPPTTYSFLPPRGIFFIDVSNCTCCILMTIKISTLHHREMLHRRIRICDVWWSLRCRAPHLGYEDIIQKYNKSISIPCVEQSVSPKGSSATEGRKNMGLQLDITIDIMNT